MHYHFDWNVVWQYRGALALGLWITVQLLVISEAAGLFLGIVLGVGRISKFRIMALASSAFIEVFRGTPPLVQLFWFYYCLPIVFHVRLPAFTTGVLSLTLLAGAYMGEIFRAGFQSVHKGQMLAARALGMTYLQAMREVILPQAVRRMLPPLLSQSVDVFKTTALVSTITVPELMYQAYYGTASTYRFVEFYTVAGLVYFAIAFPVIMFTRRLELRVLAFQRPLHSGRGPFLVQSVTEGLSSES